MTDLGASVRRVQDALATAGGGHTVIALEKSARTSAEAAAAVGCKVDQIAKSLVFRGEQSQELAQKLRARYRFLTDRDLAVTRSYGLLHGHGGHKGQDVARPTTVVIDRR